MTAQWMIRSPQLQITGPFTKEELSTKIQAGELSGEYEICAGNHYWFYLTETSELGEQLGIELPAHLLAAPLKNADEADGEVTEDFADEPSQTALVKSPAIKPAPLAPRESQAIPPPMTAQSSSSGLIKLFFAIAVALALYLILKSR